ncbi:PASTA domain-containing protein [Methanosarcina sp.]|uniref:PASTA domain-containing protein n=1 Tax=Methanosarcina sp. TaxID=2213 RepID=UPI003BB60647
MEAMNNKGFKDMKAQLEQRLIELRKEYESGQKILEEIELKIAELENRKTSLRETLLRISGAIDLLEEVLGKSADVSGQENKVMSRTAAGNVEVPNVVGKPFDKARKNLEESGLTAGEIIEQKGVLPIGIMMGEVIRQDPKPGTKLPPGSAVKLVIAVKGKFIPPVDKRSICDSFSDRN